ncbi:RalA-binding protein 1 [Mytilus galloprovincialis]|uniref:RalA-binding protein 1 n=2 Tax=Mytilus TaxID=6548 RepID=A0A8B6C7B4_MYTGA|nr:RalA-binding protein 1 [Mytilus galloprovincialis]
MSFDNQETDKGYTGDDDHDKQNRRKNLLGKKTDGKKGQKDKGYVMFDEDDSDESLVTSEDVKSPSKLKKPKGFKFSTKKKDKDKDEKKEVKKEEKEKKKEGKEHKKHKKDKKKNKPEEQVTDTSKEPEKAIFGVQLTLAVERNRCYDGVELPAMFRECIDYIEEHGLSCEGIYRISGVKSKIQLLKDCYNKGLPVFLEEHEPNIVASLLKQFLRELPEPVLTAWLMPKFEEASVLKSEKSKVERFHKLIHDLPKPNRMLLSWMIVHMTHVIERQKENKMSLQNVSIVLSPTMQISHRVLNVLFSHAKQLFKHTELKK